MNYNAYLNQLFSISINNQQVTVLDIKNAL